MVIDPAAQDAVLTESVSTEWGVAYKRGAIYEVTPCESEEAARQLQAESGGKVVCRSTYTYDPAATVR